MSVGIPSSEDQPCLLRSYAYFALKYDKYDDAIRALLKMVVIDRSNKRSLKLMGEALRHDGSVEIIFAQIPPNNASAATAYHYLANIAKVLHIFVGLIIDEILLCYSILIWSSKRV